MKNEKLIQSHQSFLRESFYSNREISNSSEPSNFLSAQILSSIDDAWNLYAGAMKVFVGGANDSPNLQLSSFASIEQKLNWDDPDFGDYYFHKISSDLINDRGANYSKTDKSFSERYGLFIGDITVPPMDMDALNKALEAKGLLDADERRHVDLYDNLNLEWQAFNVRQRNTLPPSQWKSFDQWWNDYAENNYRRSREIVLAYYQNYRSWIQKAFNGGEAISKILNAYQYAKKIKVKKPMSSSNSQVGGIIEIYPYQISEDYSSWLASAKRGDLARSNLTINKNTYRRNLAESNIAGGLGIGLGFFGAIAFGQRKTLQIDTTSENFSLTFEGVFKTFDILAGDWYNSSAFELFRTGPFYQNSPMENLNRTNSIFGPRGLLSFRPSKALVVYNPKMTVKFDRNIYHYFEQETRGFAGFCLGPFVIGGGSYYDHKVSVSNDNDNYSFSFEIKDYAILAAFDSQDL